MSAFRNVRIIDFSQGIAGPMATMLFADFEADVIKVEPPTGDRMKDHPGYLCWNRNKGVVTLDVRSYAGLTAARELIASADVAVFDNRPGELEALGLDATTLCTANPRLIHAWLPPYGTEGRWSQLPPDEMLLTAVSAVADLQLSFEERPVYLVTPQLGYAHATIAANGIAAALLERQRSGLGQALTISGLHAVASVQCGGLISSGEVVRMARSSLGGAHYGLYRCADGLWFFLGCLTAPFLMTALNLVDALDVLVAEGIDGEFTNLMRPPGQALLRERLTPIFATKTRAEWMQLLGDAGIPKGPSGIREDWFRDTTVAANDMRIVLEHPRKGTVELPGVSLQMSDTPGAVRGFATVTKATDIAPPAPAPAPGSTTADPGHEPKGRPLAGVRILDLGAFIAGTFAPTVLANYGADVVKVEPLSGDPFRPYGLTSLGHNLGKRSIAIDVKHPEGRAILEELVRGADVVLDNFRLGVRERLGIDYKTLSAINPRIITCSVTGYGPIGELAADPGFDPLLQSRSGMMMAQGGDEPVFHQIAVNDTATAMIAAFGIQVALYARERTGRGQEVQTSLAAQSILFQSGELTHFAGRPPSPTGGRDFLGPTALRRFYKCADGWIAIAATAPKHFHDVATALGHGEWAGRFVAEQALLEPGDSNLAGAITEALAAMPVAEALDRLLAQGAPAAPALDRVGAFTDPYLHANGFFQEIDDSQFGHVIAPRTFAEWSRSKGGFPRPAPRIGEHSREVLRELGVSEERIAALIASGVVRET